MSTKACHGIHQSPINLDPTLAVETKLEPIKFGSGFQAGVSGLLKNNGHTSTIQQSLFLYFHFMLDFDFTLESLMIKYKIF